MHAYIEPGRRCKAACIEDDEARDGSVAPGRGTGIDDTQVYVDKWFTDHIADSIVESLGVVTQAIESAIGVDSRFIPFLPRRHSGSTEAACPDGGVCRRCRAV